MDEASQVPNIVAAFDDLLLVFCECPPSLIRDPVPAGGAPQDQGIYQTREVREPSRDLVGLTGDEQVDSVVLLVQLVVEVVLEAVEGLIGLARYGDGARLALSRVQLDLVLQRVVIDVVEAPSRHRCDLEEFAVFHALVGRGITGSGGGSSDVISPCGGAAAAQPSGGGVFIL